MFPWSQISSDIISCVTAHVVTICSEMRPGKVRPLTFLSSSLYTSLWLVRVWGCSPLIGRHDVIMSWSSLRQSIMDSGHLRQYCSNLWSDRRARSGQLNQSGPGYGARIESFAIMECGLTGDGDMEQGERAERELRHYGVSGDWEELSGIVSVEFELIWKAILMFFTANFVLREASRNRGPFVNKPKQLSFDPGEQKDGLLTLITLIVSSPCLRVFKDNNCCSEMKRRDYPRIHHWHLHDAPPLLLVCSYLVRRLIVGNNRNYTNSAGN